MSISTASTPVSSLRSSSLMPATSAVRVRAASLGTSEGHDSNAPTTSPAMRRRPQLSSEQPTRLDSGAISSTSESTDQAVTETSADEPTGLTKGIEDLKNAVLGKVIFGGMGMLLYGIPAFIALLTVVPYASAQALWGLGKGIVSKVSAMVSKPDQPS